MKSSELLRKGADEIKKSKPNKEEKAELKARGVSKKDRAAYKAALEVSQGLSELLFNLLYFG